MAQVKTMCEKCRKPMDVKTAIVPNGTEDVIIVFQCLDRVAWTTVVY